MCTAVGMTGEYPFFGRTLDVDRDFGQRVETLSANSRVEFRHLPPSDSHPAVLGTAVRVGSTRLFFDGVNEDGLSAAALNFPKYACYHPEKVGARNIASFEFVTWVLTSCKTVDEAESLLINANITAEDFSENMPATSLHWIIADKNRSITVESVEEGLKLYDNPVGVLTNAPPFPYHLTRLADFMTLSPNPPENSGFPTLSPEAYSGGMGSMGLPGDYSSVSRFVRAAFVKNHIEKEAGKDKNIVRFFHIMDSVFVPKGCVKNTQGGLMQTAYTCCIDPAEPAYYYTTYDNRTITKKTF